MMTNIIKKSYFFLLISALFTFSSAKSQHSGKAIIAFYNLENLLDTIDSPNTDDTEFTPASPKKWNSEKYFAKINCMADVISKIGYQENAPGPSIIGLCELENKQVLEDLVKSPKLSHLNYEIVHFDSPDLRGIDVALLYRPEVFKITHSRPVTLIIRNDEGKRIYTRDQLQVSGIFDGEPMHFIVTHWPSRRGGEEGSRNLRNEAARLTRSIADSITKIKKDAKIIVMGDLNDDPDNESIKKYLGSGDYNKRLKKGQLYNALECYYRQGSGTIAYRDKWNLFDQIILTQPFLKKRQKGYRYIKSGIFNEPFITQSKGRYKGYPLRTYVGNNYHGGYSDHFPVYILIEKHSN